MCVRERESVRMAETGSKLSVYYGGRDVEEKEDRKAKH